MKYRFAHEVSQNEPEDGCCQMIFVNHSKEIHIICDWPEDNYPVGRISITKKGIRIEIGSSGAELPVTVVRHA